MSKCNQKFAFNIEAITINLCFKSVKKGLDTYKDIPKIGLIF